MFYIPSGSEVLDIKKLINKMQISAGMAVADLGCGTQGHFVFPAARAVGPEGKVYAVDILKSALAGVESRRKLDGATNVESVWSDLEIYGATAIPEASLDVTMVINNLPKEPMLKEAARLTKKGGKLVVVDWKNQATPFGPPTKDRVQPSVVKDIMGRLRFLLKEEFEAGPYHYGLIFVRQ